MLRGFYNMSGREVSFDQLKETMAGINGPEVQDTSSRRAAKTISEMIGWHLFFVACVFIGTAALFHGIVSDQKGFIALAIFATIIASGGEIGLYTKVKELAHYSSFFGKAAEFMLWGRIVSPVFPDLCRGFRELVRDRDDRLYERWNTISRPASVLSAGALVLILAGLLAGSEAWSWGLGIAGILLLTVREFRYLHTLRLTMKALQQ